MFFNGLFGNFVWDDKIYIVNNPELRNTNLFSLFGENIFNKALYYRPIPAIYFSILVNTFDTNTFFYHLIQLTMHITNSILVFIVFKNFLQKKISLFLSLIFLVHPIQVESVSYIAAAVSPLSTFFGLLALTILIKVDKAPGTESPRFPLRKTLFTGGLHPVADSHTVFGARNKSKIIMLSMLTCLILASILTKETGIIFGAICLLYTALFKKNMVIVTIMSCAFAILFYFLLRFEVGHVFFDKSLVLPLPILRLPLWDRLLHIPAVTFYYIYTFLFPVKLSIDQHWIIKNISLMNFFIPLFFDLLFIAIIIKIGINFYKKNTGRTFVFFVGWFILGMIPHLQIVPLDMTVADRWFYFSIIGLLGIIGICIESFVQKKDSEKFVYIVLGLIIIAFSFRSVVRNIDWQTPVSLYTHDLKQDPDNFDLQNNLGNELFQMGDYKNAKIHFQKSVKLEPGQSINWTNLATVYAIEKNYPNAISYYNIAIHNNPTYYPAYEKKTFIYLSEKNYEKTKKSAEITIKRFPNQALPYTFLAEANYKTGDIKAALSAAKKAYQINPSDYNKFIYESLSNNKPIP